MFEAIGLWGEWRHRRASMGSIPFREDRMGNLQCVSRASSKCGKVISAWTLKGTWKDFVRYQGSLMRSTTS